MMKRGSTVTAAKRCEILSFAYGQSMIKVGALLKESQSPKAYLAYERLMRSIRTTLRHARRQRIQEESRRRA